MGTVFILIKINGQLKNFKMFYIFPIFFSEIVFFMYYLVLGSETVNFKWLWLFTMESVAKKKQSSLDEW